VRTASTPTRAVATERLLAMVVTMVAVLMTLRIVSSPVSISAQYESENETNCKLLLGKDLRLLAGRPKAAASGRGSAQTPRPLVAAMD
jgi:hypothetical protein